MWRQCFFICFVNELLVNNPTQTTQHNTYLDLPTYLLDFRLFPRWSGSTARVAIPNHFSKPGISSINLMAGYVLWGSRPPPMVMHIGRQIWKSLRQNCKINLKKPLKPLVRAALSTAASTTRNQNVVIKI